MNVRFAHSDSDSSGKGSVRFANDSSNDSDCEQNRHVEMKSLPNKLIERSTSNSKEDCLVDYVCAKSCKNGCFRAIAHLSKDEKVTIKKKFKDSTKTKTKNNLLTSLKSQRALGLAVNRFRLGDQMFCSHSFSFLTGVSLYLINKVLSDFSLGVEIYVHGHVCGSRESLKQVQFVGWMLSFLELHGQADPVKVTTVLPAFLKKCELFEIYLEEAPRPHLKRSSFYYLFKKRFGVHRIDQSFPNIRISKYSSHSRCDVCFGIEHFRRTSKTESQLNYAKSLKFKHREKYSRSRAAVNMRKQLSITFPSDHLHMAIDGMDNSKSMIPRFMEKTKKLTMWKLPSKITGAVITSGKYSK